MFRSRKSLLLAGVAVLILGGEASALTLELAELERARLTFDRSILNQLTFGTYRDPFDELQERPYNLLFQNIGRHPNLSPWQGQEGNYTRYLNALIGNNGTANVDNDADSIQGAWIHRVSPGWAWGASAAFLAGNQGATSQQSPFSFFNADDFSGFDLRGAAARQIGETRVIGFGFRATSVLAETLVDDFEAGVGGVFSKDAFTHTDFTLDVGLRTFLDERSSWEIDFELGTGAAEVDEYSDTLDAAGAVTDRFVSTKYEISDLFLKIAAAYNRLPLDKIGETEYRISIERNARELDNDDLSFLNSGGVIQPISTLLDQDAIENTRIQLAARKVFQAGETEMFVGGTLAHGMIDGFTQRFNGLIVDESVDYTRTEFGATIGVRQPFARDRFRFIVAGHADFQTEERERAFLGSTATLSDDLSTSMYAIGIEGVMANVVFDVAWLFGDEAPVLPVTLGLPSGSRRSIEVDRLVFSAAVAW